MSFTVSSGWVILVINVSKQSRMLSLCWTAQLMRAAAPGGYQVRLCWRSVLEKAVGGKEGKGAACDAITALDRTEV